MQKILLEDPLAVVHRQHALLVREVEVLVGGREGRGERRTGLVFGLFCFEKRRKRKKETRKGRESGVTVSCRVIMTYETDG
jgi:hypothetical protein